MQAAGCGSARNCGGMRLPLGWRRCWRTQWWRWKRAAGRTTQKPNDRCARAIVGVGVLTADALVATVESAHAFKTC